ncbi:ABC transporter substrate-binding protein [Pusillimonas noertemannii]|uniref:ABC transporter substrate-binding protein n=1 Tax=Pusillimonas noertemannii TaxID=305977 RepID=UPI0033403A33
MNQALGKWLLAIGALFALSLPLAGRAQEPASADRQALIQAAQKEGSLVWYTSLAQKDSSKLIQDFEQKYGIKVTSWRSGDDNVLQRILSEAKGRAHKADVAQIQIQNMEALSREKLLERLDLPALNDLVPGAVPPHKEWAVAQITLFTLAYNTNLLDSKELPKSYQDLANPKWKGKIGVEGTDYDWFDVVAQSLGGEAGLELFRQIKQRNDASVRTGHSLLANLVVAGEVPLALNVYQYKAVQLKRSGAPLDWAILEPALAFATGAGVLRNAPHPNAARLFYEYLLEDGQKVMGTLDNIPSNTKVPSELPRDNIRFIDVNHALDNRDRLEKQFDDIFVRG